MGEFCTFEGGVCTRCDREEAVFEHSYCPATTGMPCVHEAGKCVKCDREDPEGAGTGDTDTAQAPHPLGVSAAYLRWFMERYRCAQTQVVCVGGSVWVLPIVLPPSNQATTPAR